MIREGGFSPRVENVSPNSENKFFQGFAPGVIRSAAPQGTMSIGIHGEKVRYIMVNAVVYAGYQF